MNIRLKWKHLSSRPIHQIGKNEYMEVRKINHYNRKVVKNMLIGLSILIAVAILALLFIAYIYQPKEDRNYKSNYLKKVASNYLEMDHYSAHYMKSGTGSPVILIHGGGTWLYSYRENTPYISNYFTTYAVDMPGHGYTKVLLDKPKYDLNMYCSFLLEFIERQNLKKVILVGNSWGGGWALYFAQKHPDMVEKLVLIDSSGLALHDVIEWEMFKYPVIGEAASKFINTSTVKDGLDKVFYNKDKVNYEMIKEIKVPLTFKNNRKAQYLAERNLNWKVVMNHLSEMKIPTLIIWGKNDKYLDYNYAYQFHKKIKNSELLLIDNCGHVAHEDCPDVVNKAIVDFLH